MLPRNTPDSPIPPHALLTLPNLLHWAAQTSTSASRRDDALSLLDALAAAAEECEEMIRDEMRKEYGVEWGVQVGFHAVQSMR